MGGGIRCGVLGCVACLSVLVITVLLSSDRSKPKHLTTQKRWPATPGTLSESARRRLDARPTHQMLSDHHDELLVVGDAGEREGDVKLVSKVTNVELCGDVMRYPPETASGKICFSGGPQGIMR